MEKRDLDIITNSAVNWRMYQDTTVLITGATSGIGEATAYAFAKEGEMSS